MEELKDRVRRLPHEPGVYLFKDARERIIYIGKAKDLRNRVSSYMREPAPGPGAEKLGMLRADMRGLDTILTRNEVEALILEATLIKKHKPRYNVMLKDDKSYPYIKLTKEDYPRIDLTRRVLDDGARYFGPYSSAYGVRGTLNFLRKTFPLRRCNHMKKSPCMYHHMGQCLGPCGGEVDKEQYDANVRAVAQFLSGKHNELMNDLRAAMKDAATGTRFEQAAIMRDRLHAMEKLFDQKQEAVWGHAVDLDVIGIAAVPGMACAEVLFVRNGALTGHDPFLLRPGAAVAEEDILARFVEQYYAHREDVPPQVLLSRAPDDPALMAAFLAGRRGGAVAVKQPQRGRKRKLADMADTNAAEHLREHVQRDMANRDQARDLAQALEQKLGATFPLRRIAGFDISTIQGTSTVGSAVAFLNGMPDKDGYRKFIIKSGGRDDFSSMREMAARFLRNVRAGKWPRPDLIIVDGGKGQLSAVQQGIVDAEYFDEPLYVIGFAKQAFVSHVMGREDALYYEKDEPALHMVRRVINEAHRFAISFHRKKRTEAMLGE
jgi:excinuclease ABC subunit C